MTEYKERPGCRRVINNVLKEDGLTLQELLNSGMIRDGMAKQCKKMIQEQGPDSRGDTDHDSRH